MTGKEVIPVQYDNAKEFWDGKSEVLIKDKWVKIDKQGNKIE